MTSGSPAQLPPLTGLERSLITLFGALATFMEVLDITIANVSLPAISGALAVPATQGTWVISSYTVATAVVMPLTGWLARRFGEVRLFLAAVACFALMSLMCGQAASLGELLVFRVLQGLASGPMVALSQALMLNAYPPDKRGVPMALWGLTVIVAPATGPVLGGWITQEYSWPWIFLINVPVGLLIVLVCWPILRLRESKIVKEPVDVVGLVLLVLGVGALQLMLDRGHELDWFESTEIVALAIVGSLSLLSFFLWELGEANPIVPLRLFQDYNYSLGVFFVTAGYFAFFCGVIVFPLWLESAMGYTPFLSGLCISAVGATSLFVTPVIGKNISRLNPKYVLASGFTLFSLACVWVVQTYNRDLDTLHIVLPRFLQGCGMAMMFLPATTISLSTMASDRMASATGISNFLRSLGASAAAAVSVTLWDHRAAVHYAALVEQWDGPGPDALGPPWSAEELGQGVLAMSTATLDSLTLATIDMFHVSSIVYACLAVAALALVRPWKRHISAQPDETQ